MMLKMSLELSLKTMSVLGIWISQLMDNSLASSLLHLTTTTTNVRGETNIFLRELSSQQICIFHALFLSSTKEVIIF